MNDEQRASGSAVDHLKNIEFENQLLRVGVAVAADATLAELRHKALNLNFVSSGSAWSSRFVIDPKTDSIREVLNEQLSRKFEASSITTDENGTELTAEFQQPGALRVTRTFALIRNEPILRIEEIVSNLSDKAIEALWGFRAAFSAPFISRAARIETDATGYFDPREDPIVRMRWPGSGDDDFSKFSGGGRDAFVTDFGSGKMRVENSELKLAMELSWDAEKFPFSWMTKDAEVLTLAPFSGLPDALKEGHGTVMIEPGASVAASFELKILPL